MPFPDAEYPRRSRVVVEVYNGVAKANHGTRGVAFVCGESDANARLIAAAPELLEALIAAKGTIEYLLANSDNGPAENCIEIIASAIAKAEGRDA